MADCFNTVNAQHGEKLSRKEIAEIVRDINAEREALKAKGAPDVDEALRKMVEEDAGQIEFAKMAKKRMALKEASKIAGEVNRLMRQYGDDAKSMKFGIEALLWGKYRAIPGARESLDLIKKTQITEYMNMMYHAIADSGEGNYKLFTSGDFDDEIAEALFLINAPKERSKHLDPRAIQIAESIERVNNVIIADKNAQGAFVMNYNGYAIRNAHDMFRIAKDEAGWKKFVAENIDIERSFGTDQPEIVESILSDLHKKFSTGNHMQEDAGEIIAGAISRHAKGGSIASKLNKHRGLHWKSGKAAMEYSRRYGLGNLREALFAGVNTSGRKVGIMRSLGPGDPHRALEKIIAASIKELEAAGKDAKPLMDNDWINKVHNELKRQTGELDTPSDHLIHTITQGISTHQTLTKMGAGAVSMLNDASASALVSFSHSGNMFTGIARYFKGMLGMAEDRKRIVESAGMVVDTMRYGMMEMTQGIGRPGGMAKSVDLMYKLNGMNWLSNMSRQAYIAGMLNDLAQVSHLSFDALPKRKQNMLLAAGLKDHWPAMQKSVVTMDDGSRLMSPGAMERGEAQFKFEMLVRDWMDSAVPEPGPRTKAITRGTTQAGTPEHLLLSTVMKFKSFMFAILEKVVLREMTMHSAKIGMKDAIIDSYKSWSIPLVVYTAQATMLGYASLALKDMLKNREPREFDLRQAVLASGSYGLMTDFLMGEGLKNRHGGSFAETLMGPTAGTISGFANLWGRILDGDDTASAAVKTLYSNLPGNNLWFVKAPLEVMFLNTIYEMMNPGYTRRTRERMMRDTGQDILFQP